MYAGLNVACMAIWKRHVFSAEIKKTTNQPSICFFNPFPFIVKKFKKHIKAHESFKKVKIKAH